MVLPINFEQLWKEELKNSSGVYSSRILDDEIETDFWHEFMGKKAVYIQDDWACLLYTSPSPRDRQKSRMPSSA